MILWFEFDEGRRCYGGGLAVNIRRELPFWASNHLDSVHPSSSTYELAGRKDALTKESTWEFLTTRCVMHFCYGVVQRTGLNLEAVHSPSFALTQASTCTLMAPT